MAPIQVLVMDPLFSDQSPLSITLEELVDAKTRSFKFYNCLDQHPDFKTEVRKNWLIIGGGMRGIWKNLKASRVRDAHISPDVFVEDKELRVQ
ncbi:hypothetical protein HAX54_009844, partial [Datura stramonium]|nr:hypothetical protein [Datura stramonium]